jgi:sulfur carrier protein ThiS
VKVTAVLLGVHRALLPPHARQEGRTELSYEGESVTLARVARDLGVPAGEARIVFLDGNPIQDDRDLRDGDTVTFVSPVGGG